MSIEDIKIGDFVHINNQETAYEVLSIKGNTVEVSMGEMKMFVKKASLKKAQINKSYQIDYPKQPTQSNFIDTKDKFLSFKYEIDVRGKMKDEVIVLFESWIDDAILLGAKELRVIHGRGNGVLKTTVRSLLKKYKEITQVSDASAEHGGESVTEIKF